MLVYLGANANPELEKKVIGLVPNVKFVESYILNERQQETEKNRILKFDLSANYFSGIADSSKVIGFNEIAIIESVLSDKNIALLWTRFGRSFRNNNNLDISRNSIAISIIKCAIETCLNEKPDIVVFSYEPHILPIYIYKKVCQELNIHTTTLSISPYLWRMFLDEDKNAILPIQKFEHVHNNNVQKFIKEKKSDYDIAKPFYEKRGISGGYLNTLVSKLYSHRRAPNRLFNAILAKRTYRGLSSIRSSFINKKYICFFLQVQPEMTTLPDGGIFVNQYLAIQMLYFATSKLGISLVVREHPSTFNQFDKKWRPSGFYELLIKLGPNIFFDSLGENPYTLIENSMAVSSITGTSLLEGLLLGRPAIAFGNHTLKRYDHPSLVDSFDNDNDLINMISIALKISATEITKSVESYLHSAYSSSFGAEVYKGNNLMNLELQNQARYDALCQVIQKLSDKLSS